MAPELASIVGLSIDIARTSPTHACAAARGDLYSNMTDHGPAAPCQAPRAPAGHALSQMVVALRPLAPLHGVAATRNGCQALVWYKEGSRSELDLSGLPAPNGR